MRNKSKDEKKTIMRSKCIYVQGSTNEEEEENEKKKKKKIKRKT